MVKTHRVQVVVNGTILNMGGCDDEMHMQKVAAYVNNKIQEMEATEAYRSLTRELKPILIELNIADELIQAQNTIAQLEEDLQTKENEMMEIKQRLVEAQIKLERMDSKKK